MKLIACLGNPGKQYELTRHNAGFLIGDAVVAKFGKSVSNRFNSICHDGIIGSEKVHIIFPQTYMNHSGVAVRTISHFYKIPPTDLLVLYDDFDVELGSLRFRAKGSGGTHNGMKSIISDIGTNEFCRLRIGIGPKYPEWSVSNFVLAPFTESELKILQSNVASAIDSVMAWCRGDIDLATRTAASAVLK
jgi:PTH1 family peptidyl-tRNA hydrolase